MIITEPNRFVAELHDRMPVLLQPHQFDAWPDDSAGKEVLMPAAEDLLQKVPVSQRVNSSRAPGDDPRLIQRSVWPHRGHQFVNDETAAGGSPVHGPC